MLCRGVSQSGDGGCVRVVRGHLTSTSMRWAGAWGCRSSMRRAIESPSEVGRSAEGWSAGWTDREYTVPTGRNRVNRPPEWRRDAAGRDRARADVRPTLGAFDGVSAAARASVLAETALFDADAQAVELVGPSPVSRSRWTPVSRA